MDEFTRYYMRQVGGAAGGSENEVEQVGPVFRAGFARGQRGRGMFTNALKGLWNWVSPLFSSGAQAVGKQALSTGAQILSDVANKNPSDNAGDIAKRRLTQARDDLIGKMEGRGRGRRKRKRLGSGGKAKKRKGAKRMRTKGDIFDGK